MRYAGNTQDPHDGDEDDKPSADSDFQLDADGDDDRKPAAKPTPSTQTRESNAFPLINSKDVMDNEKRHIPGSSLMIDPNDLIDKQIIADGKVATVVERVDDENYRVQLENGKSRIVEYNDIIQQLTASDDEDADRWEYEGIISHRWGKDIRKGKIDLHVKWKGFDEPTWEPLEVIKKDDPMTVAKYALENKLTEKPIWRWTRKYVKNPKRMERYTKILLSTRRKSRLIRFKFGLRVPRTVQEAYALDKIEGNNDWATAIDKEVKLLRDVYQCFKILPRGSTPPKNYQFIKLLWTFDVKFDLRKRARLVAGGHMTDPIDNEYTFSSVVSLDIIRLTFIVATLMLLKVVAADIGSAYIQAFTKELIYAIAGPEFGKHAGLILIVERALYGLKTSGAEWHCKLADNLRSMGFRLSKADTDLWMRDRGDYYEFVAVLVDDLLVFAREPDKVIEPLRKVFLYELKGLGTPEYYSGADVKYDEECGKWEMSSHTYVKNICGKIEKLLEINLKNYGSPMECGDHPELDETDILDNEQIPVYQMLIGCAQWAITLGRFDIQYATMILSRYSIQPREGHLKRVLRIFGYLKHHLKARILIDLDEPNYDGVDFLDHDWTETYPDAAEDIPDDMPKPVTRPVSITVYVDASHGSDLVTRRSVTGILLCVNKTPVKWYSKRQNTVESSTYGSELVASRIAIEMILEFRYKLRMMGIAINGPAVMFVDNEAVVKNTTLPSSTLKKKHNAIAYHKCREAVASNIVKVAKIISSENKADGQTKPLGPQDCYRHNRGVIFKRNGNGYMA